MTDQPMDDATANATMDIRQNAAALGMPEEMVEEFLAGRPDLTTMQDRVNQTVQDLASVTERSSYPSQRFVAGIEEPPYRICGSTAEGMFSPLVCDLPIGHGPLFDSRKDDAPWDHGQRSGTRWRGIGLTQEMRHPEPSRNPDDEPVRSVLEVAEELVGGSRQAEYGHPLDTYTVLAGLVNAAYGTEFLAEDMIIWHHLNKIARRVQGGKYGYHEDGVTDTGGYARVEQLMHLERRRRGRAMTDRVMGRLRDLGRRNEADDD